MANSDTLLGLRHQKSENGFTLVEIMIAVVVLTAGLLAVGSMQITAIEGNASAFDLKEATAIGENKIEEIMLASFTDAALNDTDGDGDASLLDANSDGLDDTGNNFGLDDNTVASADYSDTSDPVYSVFWNVADGVPIPNTATSRTKNIRVIVNWTRNLSITRQVTLDYVKADKF